MSYRTYWDENGDETLELEEGASFELPKDYRASEIAHAMWNLANGADRREMPISRETLHCAVQALRRQTPGFGERFRKDPRRFSSTPLPLHKATTSGMG